MNSPFNNQRQVSGKMPATKDPVEMPPLTGTRDELRELTKTYQAEILTNKNKIKKIDDNEAQNKKLAKLYVWFSACGFGATIIFYVFTGITLALIWPGLMFAIFGLFAIGDSINLKKSVQRKERLQNDLAICEKKHKIVSDKLREPLPF